MKILQQADSKGTPTQHCAANISISLIPLATAGTVLLVAGKFLGFIPCPVNMSKFPSLDPRPGSGAQALVSSSAVQWQTTSGLLCFMCVVALISSILAYFFVRGLSTGRHMNVRGIVVGCLVLMVGVFNTCFLPSCERKLILSSGMLASFPHPFYWQEVFIRLNLCSCLCLAAIAGFALLPAAEKLPNSIAASRVAVDRLGDQFGVLRVMLYLGTAVLVAGVLQIGALHTWEASYAKGALLAEVIPKPGVDLATGVNALADHLGSGYAVSSTLILMAIYIPSLIVLRSEGYALAGRVLALQHAQDQSKSACTAWLQSHNLVSDPLAMTPRIIAIVAPLVSDQIMQLVTNLGKLG